MQPKKKILAVCHDAGGSEIISAYIKKHKNKSRFICFAAGPGAGVFRRRKIPFAAVPFSERAIKTVLHKHSDAALVLTGTGWMTDLELKFVQQAKKQGMRVASYLDHWVNYRERFGYPNPDWKQNLPDEIWVGDRYALALAREKFGKFTSLKFVPNELFREIRRLYAGAHRKVSDQRDRILFASEPLTSGLTEYNEYKILQSVLSFLKRKKFAKEIIIRLHPAEPKNKYDSLLKKYQDALSISKSQEPDMFKDLAKISTVIGMESMFLVIAMLCKKRVISFLPGKKRCSLPFGEIIKIKNVGALSKYL